VSGWQYSALKNNFFERTGQKYLAKSAHVSDRVQSNQQYTKTLKSGHEHALLGAVSDWALVFVTNLSDALHWRMLSMLAQQLRNHLLRPVFLS
jgi:hypothetical protein